MTANAGYCEHSCTGARLPVSLPQAYWFIIDFATGRKRMWATSVLMCLLVLNANIAGASMSVMTETESQITFKNELHKIAHDFQTKLKGELSSLESEMYSEFLKFVEDVDITQDTLSEALRMKLSDQVAEVLEKFTKVMTYSTLRVQDLSDQLTRVLTSVGSSWADDQDSAMVFSHDDYITATMYDTQTFNRRRRHTLDWVADTVQQSYLFNTPNTDPLGPTLDDGVDVFLANTDDLDDIEDEGSPFILRDYSPVWGSRAALHTTTQVPQPRDCLDLLAAGHLTDGVYKVYPAGVGVDVWCNQESMGGGWTVVVARRPGLHPVVNFTRLHHDYVQGFGDPATHHWIGLAALHALTHHANTTLRAHLLDHRLHHAHAAYTVFSVGGPEDQYRLHVDGYDPSSTAGDALSPHSRAIFTSPEPSSGDRCSDDLDAGWWFIEAPDCHLTLPTGRYQHHPDEYQRTGGVEWRPWRGSGYSLHTLLLMIRRGP